MQFEQTFAHGDAHHYPNDDRGAVLTIAGLWAVVLAVALLVAALAGQT